MDISKTLEGKITGGHMLARAMAAKGVKKVFALCGGFINPIFMGCHDYGIEVIGCRNEMEAGFMAAAYTRVTREPAICIAEPSGFTNYVSAVAEAYYAGDPVLFISASANTHHFDNAGFKEMPQADVVRSMTRYAVEVNEGERIGWFFDKAWDIATNAPTGPVQLAIPTNFLFSGAYAADPAPTARRFDPARQKVHKPAPNPADVAEFTELLAKAKKPVVIVGPGVWYSHSEEAVADFCAAQGIPLFQPVTHVKSIQPGHPMNMGLVDYHQNPCSRLLGAQADLVILLGAQLDFPLGFGEAPLFRRDQTIVAVHPTARQLSNVMNADVRICSDVGVLFDVLKAQGVKSDVDAGWTASIRAARDESIAQFDATMISDEGPIHPLRLCLDALNAVGEDDIIVIDGGDIAAWFEVALGIWGREGKRVKRIVNPGPWEQMGTGPAFATGVKIAYPDSKVLLVTGDGSLGLAPGLTPLETSMDHKAPVTIVVANNGQWGMIQEQQKAMWGRVVATSLRTQDYAPIFAGAGAHAETVHEAGQIAPAIRRSLANNATISGLVDVKTFSARSPITQGLVDMRIKTAIG